MESHRFELDAPQIITTSAGVEILVSAVDYAYLSRFSWSVGGHGYAQRFIPRPGQLDNRRSNLRVVTASQSSSNVSARGVSGYRGVYPTRSGRWSARGKGAGEVHELGTYDTAEEAAAVAHSWRVRHLPGYVTREDLVS